MKNLMLMLGLFAIVAQAGAQTAEDALLYSQTTFGGSARGMGVAGAFGAMGADYSGIISNPAGLGLYRSSEFMFTPRLEYIKAESDYLGNRSADDRFNFNLGNIGGIISVLYEDSRGNRSHGKWVALNFGIGYNRLANLHARRFYLAEGTNSSVLSAYAAELQGTPAQDLTYSSASFESVLAYDAYLINPTSTDPSVYNTVTDGKTINQYLSQHTQGAIDELSFSVASNYDNRLYFGGYIGVPFISYVKSFTLEEELIGDDTITGFNSFALDQNFNADGVGINLKLGAIYRVNDWIRIGGAIHTPTYYAIDEQYSSDISADFDTINFDIESPEGLFDYNFVAPWRAVASLGLTVKKMGFLSFDYEYVDYAASKFRFKSEYQQYERTVNNSVDATLAASHILRGGAEVALDMFRLRGGYAYYGTPFANVASLAAKDVRQSITFGAGIRQQSFYVDVAFVRTMAESVSRYVNGNPAVDNMQWDNFVATVGFRF